MGSGCNSKRPCQQLMWIENHYNTNTIESFLQIREDPRTPGLFYGISALEFGIHGAGQLLSLCPSHGGFPIWFAKRKHHCPRNHRHQQQFSPLPAGECGATVTRRPDQGNSFPTLRVSPPSRLEPLTRESKATILHLRDGKASIGGATRASARCA